MLTGVFEKQTSFDAAAAIVFARWYHQSEIHSQILQPKHPCRFHVRRQPPMTRKHHFVMHPTLWADERIGTQPKTQRKQQMQKETCLCNQSIAKFVMNCSS